VTSVGALLLAGGSGTRMGLEVNKVYLPLGDRPVLSWSLAVLAAHPQVETIVLVTRPQDAEAAAACIAATAAEGKVRAVVSGGTSRHGSERNGLLALDAWCRASVSTPPSLTLIHDAARPFLTTALLQRLVEAAAECGGAVPGFAPDDPVYRLIDDRLEPTAAASLRRVQTPQVFATDALLAAYDAAESAQFEGVDTADTVQRFTLTSVAVVEGDRRNIKLTTAADLAAAAALAQVFSSGAWIA
jgi:2-C-methyl-D-erythritol 4-phosphate cytidylyltransferase